MQIDYRFVNKQNKEIVMDVFSFSFWCFL